MTVEYDPTKLEPVSVGVFGIWAYKLTEPCKVGVPFPPAGAEFIHMTPGQFNADWEGLDDFIKEVKAMGATDIMIGQGDKCLHGVIDS